MFCLLLIILINWAIISLVTCWFNHGLYISTAITLLTIVLAWSPVGTWYVCRQMPCRLPTEREWQQLSRPWKLATSGIEKPPVLYVADLGDEENAYAIGRDVVIVTAKQVFAPEDELTGVLAHEIGHIVNHDAERRRVALAMNAVGRFFGWVIAGVLAVVTGIVTAAPDETSEEDETDMLPLVVAFLITSIHKSVETLINLGVLSVGRNEEFRADAYAKQLGYGEGLAKSLERYRSYERKIEGIWAAMCRTHPPVEERIKRLRS